MNTRYPVDPQVVPAERDDLIVRERQVALAQPVAASGLTPLLPRPAASGTDVPNAGHWLLDEASLRVLVENNACYPQHRPQSATRQVEPQPHLTDFCG